MDVSDLKVFEAVSRHGSMNRAAQELHTVQSNVTARIRALETELGVSLFQRHARGVSATPAGQRILPFIGRITKLLSDIETAARAHAWDGVYEVLEDRRLDVPLDQRPLVGLSPDLPTSTRTFIKEQGYIVDESELAARCTVYLDSTALAKLDNQVQLINCIEAAPGPLVRFWRWPDEMKSALCVTGDLDALSLVDYASRLFTA